MMKSLLIISTEGTQIRSEAIGWSFDNFVKGGHSLIEIQQQRLLEKLPSHANTIPVGLIATHATRCAEYAYPTVLHAILDGWTLMSPPQIFNQPIVNDTSNGTIVSQQESAEWWLTK